MTICHNVHNSYYKDSQVSLSKDGFVKCVDGKTETM